MTQRLRILRNKKILEKSQNCMGHCLVASLPCINKYLELTLKSYAKTDIRIFQICLTLLGFKLCVNIFLHLINRKKKRGSYMEEVNLNPSIINFDD